MPIASKLLYFQRRPSLAAAAPEPEPEPPDPRRRLRRGDSGRRRSSLSHHKQSQDPVPGNQRDGAKIGGSAGNTVEHTVGMCSSSRLNRSLSDHGRLPDAVQQARERLLQRLNSVDLSRTRQQTSSLETIWAGLPRPADLGVSTSADCILGSLTSCFQTSISFDPCKVQENLAEPLSNIDKGMPIKLCSEPVLKLQESTCKGAKESESTAPSVECCICLEKCAHADGLIQLRCKHIFHSACLERWLLSHGDCPYCRASVLIT